jgi:flagellar hook assembly protein FlgD
VELVIWSLTGRKIKTLLKDQLYPGYYSYDWKGQNDVGQDVASGIYFCTLIRNKQILDTKKLIYLK